jgi:hypothetical protein
MNEIIDVLLPEIVAGWSDEAVIERISPMTPDASLRRYFRIFFESGVPETSIVAMIFDSTAAAEVGDGVVVPSDVAYVEMTEFFLKNGIAAPKIFHDARTRSVLLIEDLGEFLLCQSIIGSRARAFSSDEIDSFYRGAVDLIVEIQNVEKEDGFFAFERGFNRELFAKEIDEFREFVFLPVRPSVEQLSALSSVFDELLARLDTFPVALAHRDFHSWNLFLDSNREVRNIDFQDACMAPRMYDIAALLNDRDTDASLGAERVDMLRGYFFEQFGLGDEAMLEYYMTLLQRDLKVAGRFLKLARTRGLYQYGDWVPGTLRRIRRTLDGIIECDSSLSAFRSFSETLSQLFQRELSPEGVE